MAPIDLYVVGGDLPANSRTVGAGGFMVIGPGTRLELSTRHGANGIARAVGPTSPRPAEDPPCLMGFQRRL